MIKIAKVILDVKFFRNGSNIFFYLVPKLFYFYLKVGMFVKVPFRKTNNFYNGIIIEIININSLIKYKFKLKKIFSFFNFVLSKENLNLANYIYNISFISNFFCFKIILLNFFNMIKYKKINYFIKKKLNYKKNNINFFYEIDNKYKKVKIIKVLKNFKEIENIKKLLKKREIKKKKMLIFLQKIKKNNYFLVSKLYKYKFNLNDLKIVEKNNCIKILYLNFLENIIFFLNNNKINNNIIKCKIIDIKLDFFQKKFLKHIYYNIDNKKYEEIFLLEGNSYNGRNEIYLNLILKNFEKKKSILFIFLNLNFMLDFYLYLIKFFFKDQIIFICNEMSENEKYNLFNKIKNNKLIKIIIVDSFNIFIELYNVGLIIIDEEYLFSYYKLYDIRKVILKRSYFFKIPVIFSGTVISLDFKLKIEKNNFIYKLYLLKKYLIFKKNRNFFLIDMYNEIKNNNKFLLSNFLIKKINYESKNKKKILLLLNRSGYFMYIICNFCRNIIKCPKCKNNLILYKNIKLMKCKFCNYTCKILKKCLYCNSNNFFYYKMGIQKVEEELKILFPKLNIICIDENLVNIKNLYKKFFFDIKYKKFDILIITLKILKKISLNFLKIKLICFLDFDSILNRLYFRINEKIFYLLMQIENRLLYYNFDKNNIIIQTFNVNNKILNFFLYKKKNEFYKNEILLRKICKNYPFFLITKVILSYNKKKYLIEKFNNLILKLKQSLFKQKCIFIIPKLENYKFLKYNEKIFISFFIKYKYKQVIIKKIKKCLFYIKKTTNNKISIFIKFNY